MASLGDLIVRVGAEISDFQSAMRGVQDELKGFESGVANTGESIQATFNTAMQGIADRSAEVKEHFSGIEAGSMALLIAGAELYEAFTEPLKRIAEGAIDAAAETEKLQIVMTTLTGSGDVAKDFVEQLHAMAAGSPLALPTIEQGAQRLLAFGFAAKDAIPVMKTLGDVSTAFGKGDAGVLELVDALGKIQSVGTINSRLLRGLIPFGGVEAIAEGLGTSTGDVTKRAAAGSLDATTGINALLKGWSETFGGTTQAEMAGFSGMMANLKNQVTLTLDEIGKALLPVGKLLIEWAKSGQESIRGLAEWFERLPAPIQAAAGSMGLLVASLGPIALGLAAVGFLVPNLVVGVTTIAGVFQSLGGVLVAVRSTIVAQGIGTALVEAISAPAIAIPVAIVAIVAALAALATWIYEHWDGVKAALSEAWNGIEQLWDSTLGAALRWAIGMLDSFLSKMQGTVGAFKDTWNAIKGVFGDIPGGLEWLGNHGNIPLFQNARSAFDRGEAEGKDRRELGAAENTLHLNAGGTAQISDPNASWAEKHKIQVEEAAKALGKIREEYEKGKVSVEELTKATDAFWAVYNRQAPDRGGFEKTPKAHRGAGEAVDLTIQQAARAHEEAMANLQRSAIGHEFDLESSVRISGAANDPTTSDQMFNQVIAAAQKRRDALNEVAKQERDAFEAIAKQELDLTLKNLNGKLAAYAGDKDGHQRILDEKTKANEKYDAETTKAQDKYAGLIQKNAQDEENVQRRASDAMTGDYLRWVREQEKAAEQHARRMVEIEDVLAESQRRVAEAKEANTERHLQSALSIGAISEGDFFKFKQFEVDEAYQRELEAIQRERDILEKELGGLTDEASTDAYKKRKAQIDARQDIAGVKHAGDTQEVADQQNEKLYDKTFKPIETSGASALTGLIEGTKTFQQAWQSMTSSILNSWISSLAQMAAKWVAHKLFELAFHVTTNEAKVASDAGAAAQSNTISLGQHLKEVTRTAAQAAAHAFNAVVGIPFIGPVLAPIAASGAFVAVEAFGSVSAERGAVLPNENTIAFLHPKEMVLPSHISEGLQAAIGSSDGFGSNNFNGDLHYHAASGERMTVDTLHAMFQQMLRMKNLKMA